MASRSKKPTPKPAGGQKPRRKKKSSGAPNKPRNANRSAGTKQGKLTSKSANQDDLDKATQSQPEPAEPEFPDVTGNLPAQTSVANALEEIILSSQLECVFSRFLRESRALYTWVGQKPPKGVLVGADLGAPLPPAWALAAAIESEVRTIQMRLLLRIKDLKGVRFDDPE